MEQNRIKELRKGRRLQQTALALICNTTQQTISRIENNNSDVPTDLLIQLAKYFNVTTDYILGLSDIKRDLNCHIRVNQEIDNYYDIVFRYNKLDDINKKTLDVILERLEQAQAESTCLRKVHQPHISYKRKNIEGHEI